MAGAGRIWGEREANRELQVQLAAARMGIPTNSVYTSRILKDCDAEKEWATGVRLEEGVLYVIAREAIRGSSELGALAQSPACLTLEWAVVCSRHWVAARGRRAPADASAAHG